MQIFRFVLLLFVSVTLQKIVIAQTSQPDAGRYPLIPWPGSLTPATGEVVVDAHTPVLVEAAPGSFASELEYLQKSLRHYLGEQAAPQVRAVSVRMTRIVIKDDPAITAAESYRLSIKDKEIVLSAHTPAGLF